MITKFTISGFRSFVDTQALDIAQPEASSIGSGITYIVGENNSGKTNVIEAMMMNDKDYIRSDEDSVQGPVFTFYDESSKVKEVTKLRPESLVLKAVVKDGFAGMDLVQARRHWNSRVNGEQSMDGNIDSLSRVSARTGGGENFTIGLHHIEQGEGWDNFNKLVQEVLPDFRYYRIGRDDDNFIEYITKGDVRHRSDFLGEGVISVMRVLYHLFSERPYPLIIDEPELSLHPKAQERLISVIARYSKKRQIIISTHSPYMVVWEYIKNGAKINRVHKEDDTNSKINSLKDYSNYSSLINGGTDWRQPYTMDVVAREIFFSENILFVEGQEDVGLLKSDQCINKNINLFGYGVRGFTNFEFALQLAYDIGIKKAAVLLDKGEGENLVYNTLETKFGKQYKIVQWNKNDIRDKPLPDLSKFKEKNGYFNENGVKKQPSDLDDYDKKITSINSYFS